MSIYLDAAPPVLGAPVSPSPILAGTAEKERLAMTLWLARRRGLETALRNIVKRRFERVWEFVDNNRLTMQCAVL